MSELFEPTENFLTGYVKIFRSFMDHYLFLSRDPFSKREAWLYLLLYANHDTKTIRLKNAQFTVHRGETIRSLETLATDWKWDKSKVRRFLEMLQKENMINTVNEQKSTRIIISKYDTYQSYGNTDDIAVIKKRQSNKTKSTPNNKLNNSYFKLDIKERKVLFKKEIQDFANDYDKEMLNDFYIYWVEANLQQKRMRFEMEDTWELNLRLQRWQKQQKDFSRGKAGSMPDIWDKKFYETLQGPGLSAYYKHLGSLGWVPKKDRFNNLLEFVKA